jgi:hypothetical protein
MDMKLRFKEMMGKWCLGGELNSTLAGAISRLKDHQTDTHRE